MTTIHCPEEFRKALAFSKTTGDHGKHSFYRCLSTLNRLKRNLNGELHVAKDFVPYSFNWWIVSKETGNRCYDGGLICHGLPGVETLTVTLTPTKGIEWRTHT